MAVAHRTLETRGYELDRHGKIGLTSWLRYFEHLRWEAGTDEALQLGRLFEDGHRMVVRVQKLELIAPAVHDEKVRIETWLSRVGKTSFDLGHLARRESDGAELARGSATLVHVAETGLPAPVPDALRALVRDDGLSARIAVLAPQVKRPRTIFSDDVRVRPSDIDFLQHVNHAVYAAYFDDARVRAADAGAYGVNRFAAYALRGVAIEYVREVKLGDALRVHTWSVDYEPHAFGFELERIGEETPVARARFEVVER